MNTCAVTADLNRYMREIDEAEAKDAALEDMAEKIGSEIAADNDYLMEAITEWANASQIAALLARLVANQPKMVELPALALELRGLVGDAVNSYAAELAPSRLDDAIEAAEEDAVVDRWEASHG